jgi:hypothetical protein
MVRIAASWLVIGGVLLAAGPAAAQFGNIFGEQPPRPPADVPNGPFPPQPPPVQYGGPAAPPASPLPSASATRPPSSIQTQPLPPPPGTPIAPPAARSRANPPTTPLPIEPARTTPQPANPPYPPHPPHPPHPPPLQPAETSPPPPDDTVVVERPTQHIENGRAVFAGLDKITGRTITFEAAMGETVQFGALQVTPRACYTRPPTEATNTDAFVEVDEVTLQGNIKRIFTGWMFASSPGLHAVEHPIYDVWLTNCASPITTAAAEPAAHSSPASARAATPARARRRKPHEPAAPSVAPQPR